MSEIRVLLPLADGVEEMEAVIVADVLRRAGARVDLKGLRREPLVKASRGVLLAHEGEIGGDEDADLIVLPGGAEGARRLAEDSRVLDLLRRFEASGRWIAAICAAPAVLAAAGVGRGRRMTSHPAVREPVAAHAGTYLEDSVVQDGKLLTARGPGVTFAFALELVRLLFGPERAEQVRAPMMFEAVA